MPKMRWIPTAKYVFYTIFHKCFMVFLRDNFRNCLTLSSPRDPAYHGTEFPESEESSWPRTSHSGNCSDKDLHLHLMCAIKLAELQLLHFQ